MRRITFIILFLILFENICLSRITLRDCWKLAETNYPFSKNINIEENITSNKISNLNTEYLPHLTLFGQAQYQSDVTKIEISFPGINIPSIKNDQYKTGITLNQIIWDGGFIQNQKAVEQMKRNTQKIQLESEIFKIRQNVNDAYFSILLADASQKALAAADSDLTSKLKLINSRVKAGILLQSNADIIEAEIFKLRQNLDEISSAKQTLLQTLSELSGKQIIYDSLDTFIDDINITTENEFKRIEYALFELNKKSLDAISALNDSKYYPKINLFAQGGYARPGLNMLNPDFQFYYIIGVQASWNFLTWGNQSRDYEIIKSQKELINTQESAFTRNLVLSKIKLINDIEKLKLQLVKDQEIISLRKRITSQAFSQLQNGVITSTEYLSQYWAEIKAMLDSNIKMIQLLYNKYSLYTLIGLK
jgi:outer membrane protein TolC